MSVYSNILKNIVMPVANRFMGTNDMKFLKMIETMSGFSANEIKQWQDEKFYNLIKHYENNTIFYHRYFIDNGLRLSDFTEYSSLNKLPQLTKNEFIKNINELTPKNLSNFKFKHASTGGSTGDPFTYNLDIDSWSFTIANKIFNWKYAGYNYGDKHVALGSSSLFPDAKSLKHRVFHWLKNEYPLNGMNLSDDILKDYVAFIKRQKIKYLYGYSSALYLLADYAHRNNIKMPSVKGVFPTSEMFTAYYREVILQVFNCNIINSYGARDGGITAFEINTDKFHVGYNSIVCLENDKSSHGSPVLVTDLFNYATPFINYRLGDRVDLLNEGYSGYNGQVISAIYGRESEVMELDNGHKVTGPGFTILFKDLNVVHYQLIKLGGLHVKCIIQKNSMFKVEEEKIIYESIKRFIGDDCKLDLEFSDNFVKSNNGKLKYFIS